MTRLSLRNIFLPCGVALLAASLPLYAQQPATSSSEKEEASIDWNQLAGKWETSLQRLKKYNKELTTTVSRLQTEWNEKEAPLREEIARLKSEIAAADANIRSLSASIGDSPVAQKKKLEERKEYEKKLNAEIIETREMLRLPWDEISLETLLDLESKLQDPALPGSLTSFLQTLHEAIDDKNLTEEVIAGCNGPIKPDYANKLFDRLDRRSNKWSEPQKAYGLRIGQRLWAYQECWKGVCNLSDKIVDIKQENFQSAGDNRRSKADSRYIEDKEKIINVFEAFRKTNDYKMLQDFRFEYLDRLLQRYEAAAIGNPYETSSSDEIKIIKELQENVLR